VHEHHVGTKYQNFSFSINGLCQKQELFKFNLSE
jgi:hypothetical protein